jgi:hypothetical protein
MSEMTEAEFWAALAPQEITATIYRLYYDDQGYPLFYSMEDLPGKYIDIDHTTYTNPPTHARVIDDKLVITYIPTVVKLRPGTEGIPCHPNDVSIVVGEHEPNIKWSLR